MSKEIFFGGDEDVSNFKKSQTINTTSSMTKLTLSTTKAAAAPAKTKAGKLDHFQSNFKKSWFLLYCMLSQEFVVCLPHLLYLVF
jgi:hypothetical protein